MSNLQLYHDPVTIMLMLFSFAPSLWKNCTQHFWRPIFIRAEVSTFTGGYFLTILPPPFSLSSSLSVTLLSFLLLSLFPCTSQTLFFFILFLSLSLPATLSYFCLFLCVPLSFSVTLSLWHSLFSSFFPGENESLLCSLRTMGSFRHKVAALEIPPEARSYG